MAWIAVDKDGSEFIYEYEPYRFYGIFLANDDCDDNIFVPKGTSLKLCGKQMTWEDEPFELR